MAPGTVRPGTVRSWHRVSPLRLPLGPASREPPAGARRESGGGRRTGGSASAGSRRQPGRVAGEKGCDEMVILSNMTSSLSPRTGSRVPAGRGTGCGGGRAGCRSVDAGGPAAARRGLCPPGAAHHPALPTLQKPPPQPGEGRSSGEPFRRAQISRWSLEKVKASGEQAPRLPLPWALMPRQQQQHEKDALLSDLTVVRGPLASPHSQCNTPGRHRDPWQHHSGRLQNPAQPRGKPQWLWQSLGWSSKQLLGPAGFSSHIAGASTGQGTAIMVFKLFESP